MAKRMTRNEIDTLLQPRNDLSSDELAKIAIAGIEATLQGIAAGDIRTDYAIRYTAIAMGYLLADCSAPAVWAARQAIALHALSNQPPASAAELSAGVAKLRSLLRDRVVAVPTSLRS